MGMDKNSSLGSFEEMAEAAESAVGATTAPEAKTEEVPVTTEVPADNLETPKTE